MLLIVFLLISSFFLLKELLLSIATTITNPLKDCSVQCITKHPGFSSICPNLWAIVYKSCTFSISIIRSMALHHCMSKLFSNGSIFHYPDFPMFLVKKERCTASRQVTRWCWGWLEMLGSYCQPEL